MEYLKSEISSGRDHLVIELITSTALLIDINVGFRRPGGSGLMQIVLVNLSDILEQFEREALPYKAFTLSDVAIMAREKPPTIHSWVKAGILVPSMRDRDGTRGRAMLFSRLDAFVACLITSLRRKCGLPLSKLREVSALLRGPESNNNRTENQVSIHKNVVKNT